MKTFQPKLLTCVRDYSKKQFASDLVAGLIVAIIALPLSIALAIASGVSPEQGLYTAIVAGFVIACLGGSRVNISGPTAAFATIVAGIVAVYGPGGLALATLMAGVILVLMGVLRLGSLIKYIPPTITTGFTSGIALTIIIGQLKDFFGLTFPEGTHAVESMEKLHAVASSIGTFNPWALLVGGIGLAILILWPKVSRRIPGSLIAVLVGTLAVKLFNIPVNTIGDLYTITASFPPFAFPEFSVDLMIELIPNAFTIAILAAIESLLSCVVSDEMIGDRHNSNTELIAQGAGNICSSLFGGIPATGAIARTAANVKNGGRSPISGIVHAIVLLLVLLILMPLAAWIPMPIIAAILFMVAYNMSEWRHFVKICKTAPAGDILVLVLTFGLTVVFDLVVAIAIGLVVAVVLFMKRIADVTHVREWDKVAERSGKTVPDNVTVYDVEGPMFFADTDKFGVIPLETEDKVIILRMHGVPTMDMSATRYLLTLIRTYKERGVTLMLAHVNPQPLRVMKRANVLSELGEENIYGNIDSALTAASKLV